MKNDPLTDEELDFLDEQFHTHGNEESLVDVSGLDGFLTAIVSGPDVVLPGTWMQTVWGGQSPSWPDEETALRFMQLAFQHMNFVVTTLMDRPDDYEPLMPESKRGGECVTIVDSWAHGYMQGVAVGNWPRLPPSIQPVLDEVALHATEAGFEQCERMTLEEHQQSAESLGTAAIVLHEYWLEQRNPSPDTVRSEPVRNTSPKVGRNEPCPCGSGKKYKQCCLH